MNKIANLKSLIIECAFCNREKQLAIMSKHLCPSMLAEELAKLKGIVDKAHQQGRRVRFWGAPDRLPIWQTLRDAGVDLINTDNLSGLENFLRAAKMPTP